MRKEIFFIYLILIITVCLTMVGVSEAPTTATVSQNPAVNYELVNTTFTINLTVTDADDIQAWDANITFDPTIVKVVNASEGEFLKSGSATYFNYLAPENAGYIYIAASYYFWIPTPGFGVSGNGTLANITFQVMANEGNTSLHYKDDETILWYYNGTDPDKQPRILNDGFVQVRIPGDVNGDRIVDGLDLNALADAYGSTSISLNWNPDADLDYNGLVDIFDIGICSTHWEETV
jgi:hypothetical protein